MCKQKVSVCQVSKVVATGGPPEVKCSLFWSLYVTPQDCLGKLILKKHCKLRLAYVSEKHTDLN